MADTEKVYNNKWVVAIEICNNPFTLNTIPN
jgi:hypothetical protein